MSEKTIEDDLREILVALRDVDGLCISIERSDGESDDLVEGYIAGDITSGANKLAEIWRRAYERGRASFGPIVCEVDPSAVYPNYDPSKDGSDA